MLHRVASFAARLAAIACIMVFASCAGKGLLVEEYPEDLYAGVGRLDTRRFDVNPRFLVYGDTQAGWRVKEKFLRRENWVTKKGFIFPFFYLYNLGQGVVGAFNFIRHVPDAGGDGRRMMRDAVFADLERERPDFLLHLGDMCFNDGRRPRHWATWLTESKVEVPLLSSVPVVPVIGNHERANDNEYGFRNYQAVFPGYPRFYTLEFPDLVLFVVDSNFIIDQNHHIPDAEQERLWREWIVAPEGEEAAWLQRELASHDQRFKVVAMHHPPVSVGRHHGDWTQSDYVVDVAGKRRDFLDLLMDNGVQMVMSGHEHTYQHATVRRRRGADILHTVVSSGGGAPPRALAGRGEIDAAREEYLRDDFVVDFVKYESTYHFSEVIVSQDELRVNTYRLPSEGGRRLIESIIVGGVAGQ